MATDKPAAKPAASDKATRDIDPDARPLNTLQAMRLGELAGIDAKELAGQTIAALSEKLKWRIDPNTSCSARSAARSCRRSAASSTPCRSRP